MSTSSKAERVTHASRAHLVGTVRLEDGPRRGTSPRPTVAHPIAHQLSPSPKPSKPPARLAEGMTRMANAPTRPSNAPARLANAMARPPKPSARPSDAAARLAKAPTRLSKAPAGPSKAPANPPAARRSGSRPRPGYTRGQLRGASAAKNNRIAIPTAQGPATRAPPTRAEVCGDCTRAPCCDCSSAGVRLQADISTLARAFSRGCQAYPLCLHANPGVPSQVP